MLKQLIALFMLPLTMIGPTVAERGGVAESHQDNLHLPFLLARF